MGELNNIQTIQLEKSKDGNSYARVATLESLNFTGSRLFTQTITSDKDFSYYRLRITDKSGKLSYSPVIRTITNNIRLQKLGPNPVKDKLLVQFTSTVDIKLPFIVYDLTGKPVIKDVFEMHRGENSIGLPVQKLPPGIYQLFSTGPQPLSIRFVKH
jgi:hypothetical protein